MAEDNVAQLSPIDILTVGEAAGDLSQQLGVALNPISITHLFYRGRLRDDICPVRRGRRLIPRSYLPEIARALHRWGYVEAIPAPTVSDASQPAEGAS